MKGDEKMLGDKIVVGIPSLNPDEKLISHIESLIDVGFKKFIICDDGSGCEYQYIYQKILQMSNESVCIDVLRHNINLGYGRASKTIFNFFLGEYLEEIGIVECDSDGQHKAEDVRRVAEALNENPEYFYVGARDFSRKENIPFRSWFGNNVTKRTLQFFCGIKLQDTQTGLRGIPKELLPELMETDGERFEYVTTTLLRMKELNVQIKEVPIETIYLENNQSSHFNPIRDSIRIYSRIFKYCFSSLMGAGIDIFIFSMTVVWYARYIDQYIAMATLTACICAGIFNFYFNKNVVFKNNGNSTWQACKYTCLCLMHVFVSATMIKWINVVFSLNLVAIKIIVDTVLFFATYYIQERVVFSMGRKETVTNWNEYYSKKKSRISNVAQDRQWNYIKNKLEEVVGNKIETVVECGGGNSCIFERLVEEFGVKKYTIIDNSKKGCDRFLENYSRGGVQKYYEVYAKCKDLLADEETEDSDLVLSLGVIEHFDKKGTEKVIKKHFDYTKSGYVLITFPTPTRQYRFIRRCMEILGLWQFWDERPLTCEEVEKVLNAYGKIEACVLMKRMPLTQMLYIVKKREGKNE